MDYEKKYKEALELARVAAFNGHQSLMEGIFPELKESEDEKIRKFLIKWIQDNYYHGTTEIPTKTLIAWLEKQGEIDKISYEIAEKEKREFVGDGFIKCYADFQDFKEGETYWLEYVGNDNYNVRSDNLLGKTYHITPCQLYTIFKKTTWLEIVNECIYGEQKSAWSEEDEKMLNHIIGLLEGLPNLHNWLKSLKGRVQPKNHWKPSKEQMEALAWALSLAKNCGEEMAFDLRTLQDQLKKLTEE